MPGPGSWLAFSVPSGCVQPKILLPSPNRPRSLTSKVLIRTDTATLMLSLDHHATGTHLDGSIAGTEHAISDLTATLLMAVVAVVRVVCGCEVLV